MTHYNKLTLKGVPGQEELKTCELQCANQQTVHERQEIHFPLQDFSLPKTLDRELNPKEWLYVQSFSKPTL